MDVSGTKKTKLAAVIGSAILGLAATAPATAEIKMIVGDWELGFDGNVNAYYTHTRCEDAAAAVLGGLACTAEGSGGDRTQANVRTGLLPAKLGFSAATTQNNFDIQAYVSFWPGVDDDSPLVGRTGGALGLGSANFRQVFVSFGQPSWGTIKLGRDLGIFGSDAILNDMTLLGVGGISDVVITGGNTTLGGIGTGYLYADWKAQVSYWSPEFAGFSFALGVMDPWEPVSVANIQAGDTVSAVGPAQQRSPGFEAKATFDWDFGPADGRLWAGFITQQVRTDVISATARGWEVGTNASFAGFGLVAYYYDGRGIGTTAFLADAFDAAGTRRDSDGYYFQGTYAFPGFGTKLGVAWGRSNLDATGIDPVTLVERNERWTVGIYHPLTSALNLVLEYNQNEARNHAGQENQERTIAAGAIMFF
jgi:predicted porin